MSEDNALYPRHTILPTSRYDELLNEASSGKAEWAMRNDFVDWLVYQLFIRGMPEDMPENTKEVAVVWRFYSDYRERVRKLHLKPYEPPK
jgi:hypothetical protein